MKRILSLSLIASFAITTLEAATNAELEERIAQLEQKLTHTDKKLNKVKAHDAYDNIKFGVEFRNSIDSINYKYNDYTYKGQNLSGTEASNDSLLTSRLYLNMKSSPTPKLTFSGQLAMYGTWGSSHLSHDPALKGWSESSKATDSILRVREAYFVYSDSFSDDGLAYSFSVGRRPSSTGFLANMRENESEEGSPLAHITNMEVDAAMVRLDLEKYIFSGSYLKLIYGRAHSGGMETLYDTSAQGYRPYAQGEDDLDENVDFLIFLGSLYNDGQYNLMFEYATIFDTKGARAGIKAGAELPNGSLNKSLDAGTGYLSTLSLKVDGIGDEINDFLDATTLFASIAMTNYSPDDGHQLLGSTDDETGYSFWIGATIPDMITENGRFGVEYNHGSQYWTPITWAEDTAIGSKVAVRGDAVEGYWNFNPFGMENLTAQIRYTHIQHDYTPNVRCSGWVKPQEVDIESDDIRFFITYKY